MKKIKVNMEKEAISKRKNMYDPLSTWNTKIVSYQM